MIPVDQKIVDKSRGDCQRAAFASLFELELDQVPHFRLFPDDKWLDVFNGFVWGCGYSWEGSGDLKRHKSPKKYSNINGYVVAVVPSRTYPDCENITHAILMDMDGVVVHDPHPSKAWQGENIIESGELIYWYLIEERKKDKD